MNVLQYSPGQLATVIFETLNDQGNRADGYALPQVSRIIFPNLGLATGYPKSMTKLDTGLYIFKFTLPTSASAVGSYIVDIGFFGPSDGLAKQTFTQVIVSAPGGRYSATVG